MLDYDSGIYGSNLNSPNASISLVLSIKASKVKREAHEYQSPEGNNVQFASNNNYIIC